MQQNQTENPDWSVILTAYSDEKGDLIECLLAFKRGLKLGGKWKEKEIDLIFSFF